MKNEGGRKYKHKHIFISEGPQPLHISHDVDIEFYNQITYMSI